MEFNKIKTKRIRWSNTKIKLILVNVWIFDQDFFYKLCIAMYKNKSLSWAHTS